jgi:hypothetical protein
VPDKDFLGLREIPQFFQASGLFLLFIQLVQVLQNLRRDLGLRIQKFFNILLQRILDFCFVKSAFNREFQRTLTRLAMGFLLLKFEDPQIVHFVRELLTLQFSRKDRDCLQKVPME